MSYTPPANEINPNWQGAGSYLPPVVKTIGWWGGFDGNVFPAGVRSLAVPRPFVAHRLSGWDGLSTGLPTITYPWQYRPPYSEIDSSWLGLSAYTAPVVVVTGLWGDTGSDANIFASGLDSFSCGLPFVAHRLVGWDSLSLGEPSVTSPWQYRPPHYELLASWVAKPAYTAPVSPFDAQWASASGDFTQVIYPPGRRMTLYGDFTTQQTGEFHVVPAGWLSRAHGIPAINNSARQVTPSGSLSLTFGNTKLQFNQTVYANTLVATRYGVTLVADAIRWVTQQSPHVGNLHGTQKIAYRTLQIKPVGTNHIRIGVPVLGFARTITAQGHDLFTAPGTHSLRLANVLEPGGFDLAQTWGTPWVSRSPRTIDALQPEVTGRLGNAIVVLWTRYVEPQGLEDGDGWGAYTHIFNRIRYVGAQGFRADRFPLTHLIENKARLLKPGSALSQSVVGDDALVAFRIRTVKPEGWNSFSLLSFAHDIRDSLQVLPSVSAGDLTQYGDVATATGGNYTQFIAPYGQRMTLYGNFTTQQNGEFFVVPAGWLGHAYGQPKAFNSDQYLLVGNEGARYTAFGSHTAYIPWDEFAGASGFVATKYGVAMVSNEIRWIEQKNAHPGAYVGGPKIADRNRKVVPPWIVFTIFGRPTVGRDVEIRAIGFSTLGTDDEHDVRLGNVAETKGFVTADRWGWPWVSRSPRWINVPQRDESLIFGAAKVELWKRYVRHDGYEWDTYREKWGEFTHVFNKNRAVSPPGLNSFRSQPLHLIYNTARALLPFVIESPGFGKGTFIADRERKVRMDGIDGFRTTSFGNMVHNAAAQLAASGWLSLATGKPERVESNLQTIRTHSGWVGAPGSPFVADALRWVAPLPWLGALSRHGVPRISNYEQYATPAGMPPPGTGAPVLLGPFIRKFAPRGDVMTRYSYEHRVRNKTPQIYPPGRPYTEFSDYGMVSYLNRSARPDPILPPAVSRPAVQFRTRKSEVTGFLSFGSKAWGAQIRNLLPDPPSTRSVQPRWLPASVEDKDWRQYYVRFIGGVLVRMNSVPAEGFDAKQFGVAEVSLMGAQIKNQEESLRFGFAAAYLRSRYVYAEGFEHKNEKYEWFGRAQMSPHTIYAPSSEEATQQAKLNHPLGAYQYLHKIGGREDDGYKNSRWPWWGEALVTLRVQGAQHRHADKSRYTGLTPFGATSIRLKSTFIPPAGIFIETFGRTVLLPHTKTIRAIGNSLTQWGEPLPWQAFREISPPGSRMTQFGAMYLLGGTQIVGASGFSATRWGNNNPMVHRPRRFAIGGGDLVTFGVAWASFKVRPLPTEGFDAMGIDWESFADRMRVTVRKKISPEGIESEEHGAHHASLPQQFVRPYMIPPPCIPCRTKVLNG